MSIRDRYGRWTYSLLISAIAILACVVLVASSSYTTNFPLSERPLSEGGTWHHLDPTLTVVKTEVLSGVHVAHGTQNGSGGFDDSSAYLQGFGLNHSIQGTVWISPAISSSPNREIELLLRWSDDNVQRSTPYGPTSADGYEMNINQNGNYLQLGRFKGALLASANPVPVPHTGDIFKAQIVAAPNGSAVITVFWNGVQRISYTDSAPPTRGNPGIGFYVDAGAPNTQFGFSSITATNLSPAPAAPTNLQIR